MNWCFWTVVSEKTLESPLDCKELKPVHPKGNQSWVFIGRTDAVAKAPALWLPGVKNWFIGKDPDSGKDWRWEEKRKTEDEMVGWHHQLKGHESEQDLDDGEGQGSLACCSPWGHKKLDMTELVNNSNHNPLTHLDHWSYLREIDIDLFDWEDGWLIFWVTLNYNTHSEGCSFFLRRHYLQLNSEKIRKIN